MFENSKFAAMVSAIALFASIALSPMTASAQDTEAADAAPTVLITGANRGLGLEFAKQYAADGWNVIATARKPDKAEDLQALVSENSQITIEQLDVTDHDMIDALAEKYKDQPIDILLNNAGISGTPKPGMIFGKLDYDMLNDYISVNVAGPVKMSEAFVPHVKASNQKKIAVLSSKAGSFAEDGGGSFPGVLWYQTSKSALNMAMTRVAKAVQRDGISVVMLSPGLVDTQGGQLTQMGMPGLTPIEDSIGGMRTIIDDLTVETTGQFITYTGDPVGF